jgi:DNA repair protein RadC
MAARSIMSRKVRRGTSMSSPKLVKYFLTTKLGTLEHETLCVMLLDKRHRLIEYVELFRGTIDGASVHPRDVVKLALAKNAAAILLAHPHPSEVAEPSQADELITQRLKDALSLIDVRVLDHTLGGFCSVTTAVKIHLSLVFRGINREQRIQSTDGDTFGRFVGEFSTGEDCAAGIRPCRAIGGRGSIDAIGSAILQGVGARNRATLNKSRSSVTILRARKPT